MKSEKFERIYKVVMLIILTALITFIITTVVMKNAMGYTQTKYLIGTDKNDLTERLKYYKSFIDKNYIFETDENKMIDSAIKGYFAGLGDEYSEYITKEEMDDYLSNATGKYVGIGVYIANDTKVNKILVLATMKGTPAEEAGIKPGDYITKVDGVEYTGEQLSEASNKLKSEEGIKAKVEILRDEDQTIELEVERREIKITHVEGKVLNNDIGYIKISSFDDGCYKEFLERYNELKQKNIKSLIIDLRDNGGGIVKEATDIADLFVDTDATLLITKSKNKEEQFTKAKKEKEIDMPVVFLTNEGTASASEILVCAVKENTQNTKIVGTKTYGKGIIQSIFTLKDGDGIKLTTEEYFSPNHNKIHKTGITPDEEIELEIPEGKSKYELEEKDDNQLNKAIEILK